MTSRKLFLYKYVLRLTPLAVLTGLAFSLGNNICNKQLSVNTTLSPTTSTYGQMKVVTNKHKKTLYMPSATHGVNTKVNYLYLYLMAFLHLPLS